MYLLAVWLGDFFWCSGLGEPPADPPEMAESGSHYSWHPTEGGGQSKQPSISNKQHVISNPLCTELIKSTYEELKRQEFSYDLWPWLFHHTLTSSVRCLSCPSSSGKETSLLLQAIKTFKGRLQMTAGRTDSWFRLEDRQTDVSNHLSITGKAQSKMKAALKELNCHATSQHCLLLSTKTDWSIETNQQTAVFLALSYRDHTIMLGTPIEGSQIMRCTDKLFW